MRNLWWLGLLCGSLVWAQAKPSGGRPEDSRELPASAASVAADAVVLRVKGLCSPLLSAKVTTQPCETVITRAQFEKIVAAIEPNMDELSREHFARAYPRFLINAYEAQQRGLDKSERFEERIEFARLSILSQELNRQIQENAAQVPDKDIEDYYQKHSSDFETATLERIFIPLRGQNDQAGEQALTKEADALRARAATGEDFSKLQKQAYDFAGMSGDSAPNPILKDMRRRSLPLTQAAAFDLKPGEISQVITDTTGHYVYKMDSKGTVPLEAAHKEIWNVLRRERTHQMTETVEKPFGVDVNTAYFGPDKGGKD